MQGLTKSSIKRAEGEAVQAEATAVKEAAAPKAEALTTPEATAAPDVVPAKTSETPVTDKLEEISSGKKGASAADGGRDATEAGTAVAREAGVGRAANAREAIGQLETDVAKPVSTSNSTVDDVPATKVSPPTTEVVPKPAERPQGTRLRDAAARERQKVVDIQAIGSTAKKSLSTARALQPIIKGHDESRREIPLVGVALMAMQAQPDGFPRYRVKADVLSALVNKALDARGLRPELGQTLYSLRQTFEDRLTAVDAPDKIIACLMGHKWSRPRYGLGPSLEHKREWLERIAFRPPSTV